MPTAPKPELFTMFVRAAKQHGISHSFLLAVADVESGLDPNKVNSSHLNGAAAGTLITRTGLFQFSESQVRELGITNAKDPEQSIYAAASCFAAMKAESNDAPLWDVMAGAIYFAKMGAGGYPSSLIAGVTRFAEACDGTNADHWPDPPKTYAKAIAAARRYYQDAAKPEGKTPLERLDKAIGRMRELYPGMQPTLAKLQTDISDYKAAKGSQLLDPDPGNLDLHLIWFDYARFFDAAPYTDNTTPAPWRIEPNVPESLSEPALAAVKGLWESTKDAAVNVATKASEKIDEYILIGIGCATVLGALYILTNRKRSASA